MSRGTVDNEPLEHLRLFTRPTRQGDSTLFSRLGVWVKSRQLLTVDRALQVLTAANPDSSLSEIVCRAIINDSKRVQKRNSNPAKSD